MIGRGFWRKKSDAGEIEPNKGFDAFELRLGDLMRGERATLGKSLLDVQRELKIKASYIAAIENADPTAFDTPGFIAGYVRSYARYLNMDPDWAFEKFCRESGFSTSHGMSPLASTVKPTREERLAAKRTGHDIFANAAIPFIPQSDSFFSGFQPRAAGSVMVLVALISALGFGAWSVLKEVQKVKFAPVEQAPTVVADVDPLAGGLRPQVGAEDLAALSPPSAEALDRLYRPQALAVPVLVPRDGPIAALTPAPTPDLDWPSVGLAMEIEGLETVDVAQAATDGETPAPVRVTSGPVPELSLVAARPAWVRVNASDGSVLFEGILNPGDTFDVPVTESPAKLRVGESGALYFAVNGVPHGPVGPSGVVTSNIALDVASITETYQPADLSADRDLAEIVRLAQADIPAQ